ncbi:N-acetyltransferase family protein [Streptococcus cameli]
MKIEYEVRFEEAQSADAPFILNLLQQVQKESDFLIYNDAMSAMDIGVFASSLQEQYEAEDRFCLLAKIEQQVIGVINIMTERHCQLNHIGDVFVVVSKDYWGQGIGRILLEESIIWASYSGIIRRLELTVQARNQRAVSLYEKMGFEIEGTKQRGAKTKDGDFLDVYMMSRMIDEDKE